MANGVDGEVLIPIKFTVEDDKSVTNYIQEMRKQIDVAQHSLDRVKSSNKNLDGTKAIESSISSLNSYIETIESAREGINRLKSAADEANRKAIEAREAYNRIRDSGATDVEGTANLREAEATWRIRNNEANKAMRDYIRQSDELKRSANEAAASVESEISALNKLSTEYGIAIKPIDLFKESLEDFKSKVKETATVVNSSNITPKMDTNVQSFLESTGLPEIEDMIKRINDAIQYTLNAFNNQYKTVGGDVLTVDPGATEQLLEVFQLADEQANNLDIALTHLENLKNGLLDGSIAQELKRSGESTAFFKSQIDILNKDVIDCVKILMDALSEYEHEARIAAESATELQGKMVVKADRGSVGHAEVEVQRFEAMRQQREEAEQLGRIEEENARNRMRSVRQIMAEEKRLADEIRRYERERESSRRKYYQDQIRSINKEISAVRQSASQYYYKLRSMKMLGFTIKQIDNTLNKFGKTMVDTATKGLKAYLRLIPGVNALRRAFDKTHTSQKKFNKEMKNTHKTTGLANISLGKLVLNLVKASLGIRSAYMLFRKLRKAIGEGFNSMAVQLEDVNAQLSSIVTSFNYMKASITSIVQPLLNALAPALEKVSDLFEKASYYASSFMAVLTGQSYVYRAVKVQTDYAESLDKTAKSAKNAAKELGKYDKLNVIKKDKDDDETGGMKWEKVPILDDVKNIAEKLKELWGKLFDPVYKAWKKFRNFFIKSWKYALKELLKLGKSVAKDFWAVWESDTVQKIFENLIEAMGYVGIVVGNLAKNFREAWEENKNGLKILISIAKCVEIVTERIRDAAKYTAEWSEKLSFKPLLEAMADVMQTKMIPAVDKVSKLFEYLYEQILLKLVKDFIESGLPQLIQMFSQIVEIIGIIAENIQKALEYNNTGVEIIEKIEGLLQIVADKIKDCLEATKEWAKNLDFSKLLESTKRFLKEIEPFVQFLADTAGKLWTDVLLPFYQYLIEKGFPLLLDTLSEISKTINWSELSRDIDTFCGALESFFELAWETLVQIIKDLSDAFKDLVNSGTIRDLVNMFKDWVDKQDPEELAGKIEILVGAFLGFKALSGLAANVIFPIANGLGTIANVIIQKKMISTVAGLSGKIDVLTASMEGGTAAAVGTSGAEGFAAALGTVALKAGILAGAIADIALFAEDVRLFKITKQIESLPQTTSDMNGLNKEMNWFEKILKNIYEFFHPGETLADHFVGPSDYEKLEGMKDHLITVNDQMENSGTLTDDVSEKIDAALDIWLKHDEKMEDLTMDEVKQFSELFDSVEKYYQKSKYTKPVEDAIDAVGEKWSKLTDSVPVKEIGEKWSKIVESMPVKESGEKAEEMANTAVDCFGRPLKNNKKLEQNGKDFIKGVEVGADAEVVNFSTIWEKITGSFEKFFRIGSPSKVMEDEGNYLIKGLDNGVSNESKNLLKSISTMFSDLQKSVNKGANDKSFKTSGESSVKGYMSGFETQWKTLSITVNRDIQSLISTFNTKLTTSTLNSVGRNTTKGLSSSMDSGMNTVNRNASSSSRQLISVFNNNLNSHTLESAGRNSIDGLDRGMMDRLSNLLSSVKDMCKQIVDTVVDVLEIGSPSKVFMRIGEYMIDGLNLGVENEADENIIPTDFTDNFLDNLEDMRVDALDIISSMIDDINDKMEKLNFMEKFNTRMSKVSSLKVPDIAIGSVLPANIEFKQSTNRLDEKTLDKVIRNAISDIVSELNTDSNKEPIMLQLDKRVVAEAVWDEENKRYKQRGVYTR